jgi:hypothetical protein
MTNREFRDYLRRKRLEAIRAEVQAEKNRRPAKVTIEGPTQSTLAAVQGDERQARELF